MHNVPNDSDLPDNLQPTTVGRLLDKSREVYETDWRLVGGYILMFAGDNEPYVFDQKSFNSARCLRVEVAGEGIDLDAFFAICPDLANTIAGRKVIQDFLDSDAD